MRFAFRPLTRYDMALVAAWRSRPEVARWFGAPPSEDELSSPLLPRVEGRDPVRCFVAQLDDEDIAFVQTYRLLDVPDAPAGLADPGTVAALDVFVGEDAARGLGSPMLRQFVEEVVFADPTVQRVLVDPSPDNTRAIRAYARAGFVPLEEPGPDGSVLMAADRPDPAELPGAWAELDAEAAEQATAWAPSARDILLFGGPNLPVPLTGAALLAGGWRVRGLWDEDGRLVAMGSVLAQDEGARAHVGRLLVDPARRGQGWGRALLDHLLVECHRDKGVRTITLHVYEHNRAATALYRARGFWFDGAPVASVVEDEVWTSRRMRRGVR